jgi:Uncharacterized proteins of the AP superfamily
MQNKLIVISIDALQGQDLAFLKTQPRFSEILKKAAVVRGIREVYPTLTNVNHVSMITGVTPDRHGIFHNMMPFVPDRAVDWNIIGENWLWKSDYIKVPTIVDAAKSKGLVTASIMWPSMGGQVPDYNLAEMWPVASGDMYETYRRSCTANVMDRYYDRYIAPFDFKKSIDTDSFSVPIAADVIKTYKPDLLLEHIICLDYRRHKSGNDTPLVQEVLARVDGFIGTILDACKDAGVFEETNFVFLGDHGQIDIESSFNMNAALKNHGLIALNENGLPKSWQAYSFSAGFSTQIILNNPLDAALSEKVSRTLDEIKKEFPHYVGRIYTKEEAQAEEGLSGPFSFVVEAADGVCFENAFSGPIALSSSDPAYHAYRSNHGYHPSKGPKPPFVAFGPAIKEGRAIENATVLDECPTFAKILDVELPNLMGHPLDILK